MSTLELGDPSSSRVEGPTSSSLVSVESEGNEGCVENQTVAAIDQGFYQYLMYCRRRSGECVESTKMALKRWLGMTPSEQVDFVGEQEGDTIVVPPKKAPKKTPKKTPKKAPKMRVIKANPLPKPKKTVRNSAVKAKAKKKQLAQRIKNQVAQ